MFKKSFLVFSHTITVLCQLIWELLLLSGISFGTNRYFFKPETLIVGRGDSFEWHLMMENGVAILGYGFNVDAPLGGATIFNSDTLTFSWAGTGADIGGLNIRIGPESLRTKNYFGGAACKITTPVI